VNRRDLIAASVAATLPRIGRAQPASMPIVGFLHSAAPGQLDDLVGAFRSALKEAGFVEGQNITIEYRWAENDYERLPGLAADLVSRNVQVIATGGGDRSAVAAKQTTSTIPIVGDRR
jgi:putative ABC transport system substrate-binding protein